MKKLNIILILLLLCYQFNNKSLTRNASTQFTTKMSVYPLSKCFANIDCTKGQRYLGSYCNLKENKCQIRCTGSHADCNDPGEFKYYCTSLGFCKKNNSD